jgi:hypothetical protein
MSTVEEIERIVFALDDLVEEIVKRTQTKPASHNRLTTTPIKIRTLDELASREDAEVSEILDDPVGAASRHSIRRLGELLYDITEAQRACPTSWSGWLIEIPAVTAYAPPS